MIKSCNNCMGCCVHAKIEEKKKKVEYKDNDGNVWMTTWEFDGYHRYCDKNTEGYNKWMEDNKNNDDTCNEYSMECYESTESIRLMREMIDLANEILNN